MKLAVAVLATLGASACESVFPLDFFDPVPHVAHEFETLDGVGNLTVDADLTIDTSGEVSAVGDPQGAVLDSISQDPDGPDLALVRVDVLTINAKLRFKGERPVVVIANRIEISAAGEIDASSVQGATDSERGAGGGIRSQVVGRGADGSLAGASHSGGGGGGFAEDGGAGGGAGCVVINGPIGATAGGKFFGTPELAVLEGGGAGGDGEGDCPGAFEQSIGGNGGGALQLTAFESITNAGKIHANGAGGLGGFRCSTSQDGAGSGGGAGGALYIDSPVIDNDTGVISANGGGGGGGNDRNNTQPDGPDGKNGLVDTVAATGGEGVPSRGTRGGSGGALDASATNGVTGMCALAGEPNAINGGGGGGAPGRIVLRGTVSHKGDVSPAFTPIARAAQ